MFKSFHVLPQAIMLILVHRVCLIFNLFNISCTHPHLHFAYLTFSSMLPYAGRQDKGWRPSRSSGWWTDSRTVSRKGSETHTLIQILPRTCSPRSSWFNDLWLARPLCIQVSSLILKDPVTVKHTISRSKTLPFLSSQSFPSSLSHHPHLPAVSSEPRPISQSSSTSLGTEQTSPEELSHWPASSPSTSDPRSCPVLPGRETTIEICKENLGLGLSIVGGCDTLLVRKARQCLKYTFQ